MFSIPMQRNLCLDILADVKHITGFHEKGCPLGKRYPMKTHGNPWKHMETQGTPWKPMEITEHHRYPNICFIMFIYIYIIFLIISGIRVMFLAIYMIYQVKYLIYIYYILN